MAEHAIESIGVRPTLVSHPAVAEAAVVRRPDEVVTAVQEIAGNPA